MTSFPCVMNRGNVVSAHEVCPWFRNRDARPRPYSFVLSAANGSVRCESAAMRLGGLACAVVVMMTGCLAAPREVETVVRLGAERVDIDVELRDIRTAVAANDDLGQLQIFGWLHAWQPEWTEEMPWAPTPHVYQFNADAGVLSLTMHGTMRRAAFDACARGFAMDGGAPVCPGFPLQLDARGYSAQPFVDFMKLKAVSKTSWPANAKVLSLTLHVPVEVEKVAGGPRLIRGFELYQSKPAAAQATIDAIGATETRLNSSIDGWKRAFAEVKTCFEMPWCALQREALRRSQAQLIYRTLQKSGEAGLGVREPPEYFRFVVPDGAGRAVPADALPLIDALRLRVAYDAALIGYRDSGSFDWAAQAWLPQICRAAMMKKKSLRELCTRLGSNEEARD